MVDAGEQDHKPGMLRRVRRRWLDRMTPVQLLAVCLGAAVLIGSGLLMLPFAHTQPLRYVDALFTATSAVCVTGLIAVDTGTAYTGFGQAVILCLIQLGGLGVMATSTFVLLALGKRASMRNLLLVRGEYTTSARGSALKILLVVGFFTVLAEAAGALLLGHRFSAESASSDLGKAVDSAGGAAWCGVFHSVSAFCNAGFSLFPKNMIAWRSDLTVTLVMPLLIIVGGIGFPAMNDVLSKIHWRLRGVRTALSLHAKIVFTVTGLLLVLGTVAFFVLESPNFAGAPFWERLGISWFQSATTRTAGFNTLDFGAATEPTILVTIWLMFIGGAPGGTAGGIKVTTFAVLLLIVVSRLRGHERLEIGKRTIPEFTMMRALVVALLCLALVFVATFALLLTDGSTVQPPEKHGSFLSLLFEVVSAFGTVGLSMISTAATGALTWMGKLVIIAVMFAGRVGPLALAQMVLALDRPLRYRYPEEQLLVG